MEEWKETQNDYKNERELNGKLKEEAQSQAETILSLKNTLSEITKQMEELELKQKKNQEEINLYNQGKKNIESVGKVKIEDLRKQLEKSNAQSQFIQNDNSATQEKPQEAKLEIKQTQKNEANGKLKVEIKLDKNYSSVEIQEKLQKDKKHVEFSGYAILDFTLFNFKQVIELQNLVQQRESIQFNGLAFIIIYN